MKPQYTTSASQRSHQSRQRRFRTVLQAQIALAERRAQQREAALAAQTVKNEQLPPHVDHTICFCPLMFFQFSSSSPCCIRPPGATDLRLCYEAGTSMYEQGIDALTTEHNAIIEVALAYLKEHQPACAALSAFVASIIFEYCMTRKKCEPSPSDDEAAPQRRA